MTVTIIGAGPVGLLTAYFLKQRNLNLPIRIYDKSNRPGGRMTSTRMKSIFDNKYSYLDFGAQYFSYNDKHDSLTKAQNEIIQFCLSKNILENFELKNPEKTGEPSRYGGSIRIRAREYNSRIWEGILGSNYLENLNVGQDIFYNKKIDRDFLTNEIDLSEDSNNLLISTMPIPQLVQLLPELSIENHKLASSTYTCRFCLGYVLSKSFFDEKIANHEFYNEYRYLTTEISDKIIYIRFVEFDPSKIGVMIHSQTIFTNTHKKEIKMTKEEYQPILENEFCRLFDLTTEQLKPAIHSQKPHKWLYTTPDRQFQESVDGCVKLKLAKTSGDGEKEGFKCENASSNGSDSDGNLIVTGDAFCHTYPNFINSIEVAYKVANNIDITSYN